MFRETVLLLGLACLVQYGEAVIPSECRTSIETLNSCMSSQTNRPQPPNPLQMIQHKMEHEKQKLENCARNFGSESPRGTACLNQINSLMSKLTDSRCTNAFANSMTNSQCSESVMNFPHLPKCNDTFIMTQLSDCFLPLNQNEYDPFRACFEPPMCDMYAQGRIRDAARMSARPPPPHGGHGGMGPPPPPNGFNGNPSQFGGSSSFMPPPPPPQFGGNINMGGQGGQQNNMNRPPMPCQNEMRAVPEQCRDYMVPKGPVKDCMCHCQEMMNVKSNQCGVQIGNINGICQQMCSVSSRLRNVFTQFIEA